MKLIDTPIRKSCSGVPGLLLYWQTEVKAQNKAE
jgi:hypothetical protein